MPILAAEPEMFPENLWEEVKNRPDPSLRWYCLHTRPRQEKALARDLRASQAPFYLPQMIQESRTPAGRKIRSILPLFGGYLFLHGHERHRVAALKTNRLVSVLEVLDQERLADDLRQIQRMLHSGLEIQPESTAPVGGRVRIASGPLTGLVGTVIRRGRHDHFVAVVQMLGLGATVTLEDWQVEVLND